MAAEEVKDPLKDVDWKNMGNEVKTSANKAENEQLVIKKRLPKKIRQIPDYYFLPRRSLPSAIAFYGSFIVAGVGAGMLLEVWINKKVKVGLVHWSLVQSSSLLVFSPTSGIKDDCSAGQRHNGLMHGQASEVQASVGSPHDLVAWCDQLETQILEARGVVLGARGATLVALGGSKDDGLVPCV